MAALTASCIDLNIQGNGAYAILKQLATYGAYKMAITDRSTSSCKPCCCAKSCTLLDLVPASPSHTVKAPVSHNPSCYSPAKQQAIDWKASDGEDVNCWICLGVPQSGEDDQVKIIGTLCRKIIHQDFIHQLKTRRRRPGARLAQSDPQLIRKWRWSHPCVLVAITNCPAGYRSHLHGGGSPGTESPFARPYHKSRNSRAQAASKTD
jgi:fructose-like PTS system EIIA component